MVNLEEITTDTLEDIYRFKDFVSFWYYDKEEKKAYFIDACNKEYYRYNDFIDFENMVKEIYRYNKEDASEVLYTTLIKETEVKKVITMEV